jgi:hypothetical protein
MTALTTISITRRFSPRCSKPRRKHTLLAAPCAIPSCTSRSTTSTYSPTTSTSTRWPRNGRRRAHPAGRVAITVAEASPALGGASYFLQSGEENDVSQEFDEAEHKLNHLRRLQDIADKARRWHAKRDQTIQLLSWQGTANLAELAGAAGLSKARVHQIARGPGRDVYGSHTYPPARVQLPKKGDRKAFLQEIAQEQTAYERALPKMQAALDEINRRRAL